MFALEAIVPRASPRACTSHRARQLPVQLRMLCFWPMKHPFSSPEAALLLVSTKNHDLWLSRLSPTQEGEVNTSDTPIQPITGSCMKARPKSHLARVLKLCGKIGTFSNADFCDGDGDRKSNSFPVDVSHFGGKPFSLRADVRTASFPLSTKREYIFCFYALNIYHFFLIWFPKASKRIRQYKIGI